MTTLNTLHKLVCVGLCSAALVACGDDGAGPTASNSNGQTETSNGDEDSESNPSGATDTKTSQDDDDAGTVSNSGNSNTEPGPTEPDPTTNIGVTDTGDTDPTSDTETTDPVTPVCGNGTVEGQEQCDDGNQDAGDGCEANCTITQVCGDGDIQPPEICDDGNTNDDDGCSADCLAVDEPAVCGDGVVQPPEVCDDGNTNNGDGCEDNCTISPPVCGNNKIEGNELCDDGNQVDGGPGDFCKNDCTPYIPPSCQAPPEYIVCDDNLDPANKADKTIAHKAMGICNDQPNNSVQITDYAFNGPDNASWTVAKGFGDYMYDHDNDPATPVQRFYSPREGQTFLMISSGQIVAPNAQGIVLQGGNTQKGVGSNTNPDVPNTMPAPLSELTGSANGAGGTPFVQCDGVTDCSDTLESQWNLGFSDPNDYLYFTFKTKVPLGTFGYSFDFVYCSAEWPEYVGTPYNDMLVAWQTDPTADNPMADPPIDPYTGNVTFIPNPANPAQGLPLTITALDPYLSTDGYSYNEPQLSNTGFQQSACSGWFTAKGGVQPGADLTIAFYINDMYDTIWTTTALLDNFRWDCKGCVPSEVDDCGIQQPQ